jgi:hypothetical protein
MDTWRHVPTCGNPVVLPTGRRTRLRDLGLRGAFVGGLLFTTALLVGCDGGGGGGDGKPQTTANVSAVLTYPAGGAPRCTAQLTWRYEPVALTGSEGTSDAEIHDRTYDVPAVGVGVGECRFDDAAFGLRPGRWRISATSFAGTQGTCTADLRAASIGNSVKFTSGQAGCTTFP